MSPVGITMLMSRRYLFIAGTRTLLEIPGTVAGVDGMRRLRWNRRTIQSETSHSLSSEFHLLRGRFLVTQHPLNDLSAEIHLSVQLLLIVINHPNLGKQEIHALHQGFPASIITLLCCSYSIQQELGLRGRFGRNRDEPPQIEPRKEEVQKSSSVTECHRDEKEEMGSRSG